MSTVAAFHQLSVDDLTVYARQEGEAFSRLLPRDVVRLAWRFEPCYPVPLLVTALTAHGLVGDIWTRWWSEELHTSGRGTTYLQRLRQDFIAAPDTFPPVVIAEMPDQTIDIGDGWHRSAVAILEKLPCVPAVVGTLTATPLAVSVPASRRGATVPARRPSASRTGRKP